jgi:hypothetical protein
LIEKINKKIKMLNINHFLIIIYLHLISYISSYVILEYVSKYIYTSIITSLLMVSIIDGYNLLKERDNYYVEYKNTYKLLELQMIENRKLEDVIKAFKKR